MRAINNKYYPNLNVLRFIATMMVFLPHIEQIKESMGLANHLEVYPIELGKSGVTLFFVLSGFLIVNLLLREKKQRKRINLKNFFFRRILKLFPLYYTVIIIGLFIIPVSGLIDSGTTNHNAYQAKNIVKYLLFFPYIALPARLIAQTWSLEVEKMFYLISPFLARNSFLTLFGLISITIAYSLTSILGNNFHFETAKRIVDFIYWFRIDLICIGGIFGFTLATAPKIVEHLTYSFSFWVSIICLILVLNMQLPVLHFQVLALLSGVVITNLATGQKIPILENSITNILGRASYSIYLFHPLIIVTTLKILNNIRFHSEWIQYPVLCGSVILLSTLIYQGIEKPFQKLKSKFS